MRLPSPNMLIDHVDDKDHVVGTVSRSRVFQSRAGFRVAHVFGFDGRARLLLQRLALNRQRHPGYWGSSVAAYLFAGEDYRSAARRRLEQELGLRPQQLRFALHTRMEDNGCSKWISLYTTMIDAPLTVDSSHIAEVDFLSIEDIQSAIDSGARRFTPTFLYLFNRYQGLASDED